MPIKLMVFCDRCGVSQEIVSRLEAQRIWGKEYSLCESCLKAFDKFIDMLDCAGAKDILFCIWWKQEISVDRMCECAEFSEDWQGGVK